MKKAFAVLDLKAASYGTPMFMETEGVAMRSFTDACADPRGPLNQHPEDFVLVEIGSYDPNLGRLDSPTEPRHIMSAMQGVEACKNSSVVKATHKAAPDEAPKEDVEDAE